MFEFKDEKLGKVKVVNVTEARSSIAGIMGDTDFNYVITKNNKPIRVVVNYETFRKSQMATKAQKPAEAKGSLQGLIQTKEKEIKRQEPPANDIIPTPPNKPEPQPVVEKEVEAPSEELPIAVNQEPSVMRHESEAPANYFENSPAEETAQTESEEENSGERGGDYFSRYSKLYEAARYEPLFQNPSPPPQVDSHAGSITITSEIESAASLGEPPSEPAPKGIPPKPPEVEVEAQNEAPSIQDILKDLENEQLSGEEEHTLTSEQVHKMLNRVTNS